MVHVLSRILRLQIPSRAKLTLAILANEMGDEASVQISLDQLSLLSGHTRNITRKNLSLLKTMGMIEVIPGQDANGGTTTTTYRVRPETID